MSDTPARPRRRSRGREPGRPVPDGAPVTPGSPAWNLAVAENLATLAAAAAQPAGWKLPAMHDQGGRVGWHEAVTANLAALNELTAELIAAAAPDKGFARDVDLLMRDHTWAIGYKWRGQDPPAGWAPWYALERKDPA
jgi:hypothetical protein